MAVIGVVVMPVAVAVVMVMSAHMRTGTYNCRNTAGDTDTVHVAADRGEGGGASQSAVLRAALVMVQTSVHSAILAGTAIVAAVRG
jgi:hypothetical protein